MTGSDAPQFVGATCPQGQLAVDVDGQGNVRCEPVDGATQRGLDARCAVYFGWRDACDGCTLDPAKSGFASGAGCTSDTATNDTCSMAQLGANLVPLFGLNTDGSVDDNDKFYTGLHCLAVMPQSTTAPCPADAFVTGVSGGSYTCEPLADLVAAYVSASCSLYFGWQDSCGGCTAPPTKWGVTGDTGCMLGTGTNDTCTVAMLGGERVHLFGLNTDGTVDDNDKFHVGLACQPAAPATGTGPMCPAGQFVAGVNTDGSLSCTSAAPLVASYVHDHCQLYFGWRDSCDGCTTPPAKWGSVGADGSCSMGAGANDTCTTFTLGTASVEMFGLNTGGTVDDNDKFYVGLLCR